MVAQTNAGNPDQAFWYVEVAREYANNLFGRVIAGLDEDGLLNLEIERIDAFFNVLGMELIRLGKEFTSNLKNRSVQ